MNKVQSKTLIDSYLEENRIKKNTFFDELVAPDGSIYPHWKKLVESYNELAKGDMDKREQEVLNQLRENGVTYNVYGDPKGMNRPWVLDPVPVIFSEDDWKIVEKGLAQRAMLLNSIFIDIYGERKLLRDGLIPYELIYNHKGFLRQVANVNLPFEQQLIQYSADLARGPDGKMWVLHDRTDAPSGAGYTLENRAAMTRVFPELIREYKIQKIHTYYQTLKNTLTSLAYQNKEAPHVIFLTPGEGNETYFEHAYLSSFMGFTLATGNDLTVNDGTVWLKTIKGLEKVDVIVRRVDDVYCDPLEFHMDSQLGVVGLTEAVRQNKVLIINPLGIRVLENPGLMAFLPALSRHILGEELILPSVATWWCGQQREKEYVLDNIRYLVIKRIYRDIANKSIYGQNLSEQEIAKLKDEINARPQLYVGQEVVNFSTTPSYIKGKLEPRNAVFRSYVVADASNKSYFVMPGGLSRSSITEGVFIVSNQSGGISKDTWVMGKSEKKVDAIETAVHSSDNVLPSRTAENLFWLGRYVERSIFLVRLIRVILRRFDESDLISSPDKDVVLCTLLQALTNISYTFPGFNDKQNLKKPEAELISIISDKTRTGSLNQSLTAFVRNGYSVRDRLGLDIWRILDKISEDSDRLTQSSRLSEFGHLMDNLLIKLMAFHGLTVDTMTREASWNIQVIGRFIESSIKTASIIRNLLAKKYAADIEKTLMEYLLINNESLITYRYNYRSTLEVSGVLSMLLLNELNPRSVIYMVNQVEKQLAILPKRSNAFLDPIQKKLLEITTLIRLCDPNRLSIYKEADKQRSQLIKLLDEVIISLNQISSMITNQYFNHTENKYGFVKSKIPEI